MRHEGIHSWSNWGQHRQSPDSITRQILHSAMKHIDDSLYYVNQALSWSSAHTVFPNISSLEFPLPSIATASEQHRFQATTASEHPCFRATASTATSLPGNTSTLPGVATTTIFASEGNNIGSDQWFNCHPLPQKATTLVPINGSRHELYGIRSIIG